MNIRNIAIIAHVDHGKTTLVDAMLKQTHTFRTNEREMQEDLIMDSNPLEKEKGITILSKNTSVLYRDTKINIIDTPGHADFGGEVERVLNMASGALLLVDAAEGPLPQTKFVLKKAIDADLKLILLINKIDKKDARPVEIIREIEDLFLDLAKDESHLHFKTLYTVGRDGKAFTHLPSDYSKDTTGDLEPLFKTILEVVPNSAHDEDKPFQMLISTLDYDSYVGKICIGKVTSGMLSVGQKCALTEDNKVLGTYKVSKLFTSVGLKRNPVETVSAGDIVAIAGIPELTIGQTVTDPDYPVSLPKISVEEPTIKITLGANTSPFSGKEGKYSTSRQIRERIYKEKETNLGLRIEEDDSGSLFTLMGRGELHLAILIETMRREGYEMQVSKPNVIYKKINNKVCEPFEEVTIDVDKEHTGAVTEELGKRKALLVDMLSYGRTTRLIYKASSANLIGIRNALLTSTRGTATLHSSNLGYFPAGTKASYARNGALIASKSGTALTYGLGNAQDRGILFVGHGTMIYEGMVVGVASRPLDIEVNVCKAKQLTNNRSSGEGVSVSLTPPTILSLEQSLDFIADDELLEVTPVSLRIRKKVLSTVLRRVSKRGSALTHSISA